MNKKEISAFKNKTKAAMKRAEESYAKKSPAEQKEIDERAARLDAKTLSEIEAGQTLSHSKKK